MQQLTLHQKLQNYLKSKNPKLLVEHAFFSTRRIADLFWQEERIVFEIQSSPITPEEALGRMQDYAKEGTLVVWLLDDRRFNQKKLGSAEQVLRRKSCYFFSQEGFVYDQYELVVGNQRVFRGPKLLIDLLFVHKGIKTMPSLRQFEGREDRVSFKGDLYEKTQLFPMYLKSLRDHEEGLLKSFLRKKERTKPFWQFLWAVWERLLQTVCQG